MFDTPPSPRRNRAVWVVVLATAALFVVALITIHLQSSVTQLRYQVAHLSGRQRLWLEHVQAQELEIELLRTPPRLRNALGPRHDVIEVTLFRKSDAAEPEAME